MANSSAKRTSTKRLARAKPKPQDEGKKKRSGSRGGSGAAQKKSKAESKADRKKRIGAIIIVVFAILMALSMMTPSCSAIVSNNNANQQAEDEASEDASTSDESTSDAQEAEDSGTSEETTSTMDSLDATYESTVEPLKERLEEDPENLAALLNLGNDYMSWGYAASTYATTDEEAAHATELLEQAISYFDSYLELNDSDVVKVNRALCLLYEGDADGAQEALEALTEESPESPLAWANLGLVYEYQGNQTLARSAYEKAEETDPDDAYGALSYAESRIESMNSSNASTITTTTDTDSEGAAGLTDALGGLGL